jgi:hypothetical protein
MHGHGLFKIVLIYFWKSKTGTEEEMCPLPQPNFSKFWELKVKQ